jgi:hypothetical protein
MYGMKHSFVSTKQHAVYTCYAVYTYIGIAKRTLLAPVAPQCHHGHLHSVQ